MYVIPSDGVDRSFDVNDTIVNSTAAWESWLSDQTGSRKFGSTPISASPTSRSRACLKPTHS